MDPATINLTVARGDSKRWVLTLKNSVGVPYNITGWTLFFTVKSDYMDSDDDALIQKDIITHTDATNGQSELILAPVDTSDLVPGDYYYDIQAKQTDNIYTLQRGLFTVTYDVTSRTSTS